MFGSLDSSIHYVKEIHFESLPHVKILPIPFKYFATVYLVTKFLIPKH